MFFQLDGDRSIEQLLADCINIVELTVTSPSEGQGHRDVMKYKRPWEVVQPGSGYDIPIPEVTLNDLGRHPQLPNGHVIFLLGTLS